jgi:hypothetical protein
MNWFNRLEHKFGHLAIPHLIRVVVLFNVLVYILYRLNPPFLQVLTLDPERIMAGEIWRLVSYIFIPSLGPQSIDWLLCALYLYFLWWIGDGLEDALGSFRLNVFYFLGVVGCTVGAFFAGGDSGYTAALLNSTLFFAFARFFPEMIIYLMFIVPVKVKWMAWVSGFLLVLGFVGGDWSYRIAVIIAFSNYLLFFGREIIGDAAMRVETEGRRKKFEAATRTDEPLHQCKVCGRTEASDKYLEFRVAADGEEYCTDHIPARPQP